MEYKKRRIGICELQRETSAEFSIEFIIVLISITYDCNVEFSNFNFEGNIGFLTVGIICLLIFGLLKVAEFFLIIYAAIKTSNGEHYRYPITIPFIK